jgi:hypothetical protein
VPTLSSRARVLGPLLTLLAAATGCSNEPSDGDKGNGATGGTGGSDSGGTAGSAGTPATGGSSGAATGGTPATGGSSGAATGGTPATGGSSGAATGGSAGSGGAPIGGSGGTGAGGTAGGGSGCDDAIFCDDFDDAPANGAPEAPWVVQRGGAGAVIVDTAHHMSGTQSVKFTVPAQADSAFIALRNAPTFPVTGNAFYGRVMLWLTSAPTTTSPAVHWTLIEGSGLVPGQTYHAAYRLGGQHAITAGNQLMANYETPDSYGGNGPSSDCWHHATGKVVPLMRWACVEWQYDGPNSAMTMWIDGAEILTVRGMGSQSNGDGCVSQTVAFPWTAPDFDTIRVGWDSYQTDAERTLWLDDFAISATRVGCPSGTGQ